MDDIIIIHFERTGGITGISLEHTADLRRMEPDEAGHIQDLVFQAGLITDQNRQDSVSGYPDHFMYKIIIETTISREVYYFPDEEVPEEAWPLIRYLMRKARKLQV